MNLHVQSHIVSATEALRHLAVRKPPTVAEAGLHGVSSDAIHFQYDLEGCLPFVQPPEAPVTPTFCCIQGQAKAWVSKDLQM